MDPQQTPPPVMTPQPIPPVMGAEEKSSPVGSIVGAIIVIVVIIFGGLYFWGAQLEKQDAYMADELPFILGDDETQGLPATSPSDEVADIEADVAATDLDQFDAQIDADMQAAETQI